MANTTDDILHTVLTLQLFKIPIIKTSINYEDCFHSSIGEDTVSSFIIDLTRKRERLRCLLSTVSYNETLQALDEYLPLVWQLLDSLDRQDPVPLDSPLKFSWISGLGISNEVYSFGQIIFELIMTLNARALCLANLATETARSDVGAVNAAAKLFREASSVMLFISSNVVPRWQGIHTITSLPPECNAEYAKFLSDYFTTSSHQMVVAKALQGSTPSSVMMGLCVNVVRGMEFSLDVLYRLASSEVQRSNPDLPVHMACIREYLHALVYAYQADNMIAKTETGVAIALCAVANKKLEEKPSKERVFDPLSPGMPRMSKQSSSLRRGIVALAEKIQTIRKRAENDNSMIYFKPIPRDMSELPELPPPTTLNLPTTVYDQPSTELIQFAYDPKRKRTVFNALNNMFSKSKK